MGTFGNRLIINTYSINVALIDKRNKIKFYLEHKQINKQK